MLYAGAPLPHFNEVDEGVAVDALITNRVWTRDGPRPGDTLHDVRWGEDYDGQFVWVFEISGSVPASHLGGYDKAEALAAAADVLPARRRHASTASPSPARSSGRGSSSPTARCTSTSAAARVVELPDEETQRRKDATNPEWPIMHVVLHGVTRDQFMARHKANHAQVVYAPDAETADKALIAKAAFFDRSASPFTCAATSGSEAPAAPTESAAEPARRA